MKGSFQELILPIVLCALLAGLGTDGSAQEKTSPSYDGHWWLSVSSAERVGFLDGYYDCYSYEYKGPALFGIRPPFIARDLVTKFYQEGPTHLSETVSDVFYRFRDRPGEEVKGADGERIRGRHGFYDGTYWKQISLSGKAEQLGFVEGYLWCHKHLSRNGSLFSKGAAEYVGLITQWYGLNENTGDMDEKREPTKIADVLFKFRDRLPNHPQAKDK